MAEPGHFTIFSGPPRSGKTEYSNQLSLDPKQSPFVRFEGHGEFAIVQQILNRLSDGINVIYETTHSVQQIPAILLARADTIELFRRKE